MESKWKSSTLMIFWSVILIAFAGFFASIFDLIDSPAFTVSAAVCVAPMLIVLLELLGF